MKIRKDLLAIKGHFFFMSAGTLPILTYIPVIAKELGYSSVAVGWAYSVSPIFNILIKPMVGSFVDKFSCHKKVFVLIALLQIISVYFLQYLPSLPLDHSVLMNVNNDTTLVACSSKLADECYSTRVVKVLNSSLSCELEVPGLYNGSLPPGGTGLVERQNIQLGGGRIENSCVSMMITNATNLFALRRRSGNSTAQLYCTNEEISDITTKPILDDDEIFASHQYWIFFFILVEITVLMYTCNNIGDTLCLGLLGDRTDLYGSQRMWASVGWGPVALLAAYIVDIRGKGKAHKDFTSTFYICLFLLSINLLITTRVKAVPFKKSENIFKDVRSLFKNRKTNLFIVWSIFSGSFTALCENFGFWLLEDLAGRNGCANKTYIKTLEGFVLLIHCVGEVPFYILSGWIFKKIGHENVMRLIILAHAVRFFVYWLLVNPWWVLSVEILNGITKGLDYSFITSYAGVIAAAGTEATVQSVLTSINNGLGSLIGNLIGGYLIKTVGSSETFFYLSSGAFAFVVVLIIVQYIMADDKPASYTGVAVEYKEPEKGLEAAENCSEQ